MIDFYPIEVSLLIMEQEILEVESCTRASAFSFYPPKMIQLIKVGEEVNRMDYFFEKIAAQYIEEVEYKINAISSCWNPLSSSFWDWW